MMLPRRAPLPEPARQRSVAAMPRGCFQMPRQRARHYVSRALWPRATPRAARRCARLRRVMLRLRFRSAHALRLPRSSPVVTRLMPPAR